MKARNVQVRVISCEDATSKKSGNDYTRLWLLNDGAPVCVFPPHGFQESELHKRLRAGEAFDAVVTFDITMEGKFGQSVSIDELEEAGAAATPKVKVAS